MNLLFFFYFIIRSDYKSVIKSLKFLQSKYNIYSLIVDCLVSSVRYGTSFDDYFSFRFYEKKHSKRKEFASTGFMYRFHKKMNEKTFISKVDDKSQFRINFKSFTGISEVFHVDAKNQLVNWLKTNKIENFVLKDPLGTLGKSIQFVKFDSLCERFSINGVEMALDDLFKFFSKQNQLYLEPFLKQHPLIQNLAPTALNTIRIITILKLDGNVDVVSAAFRISLNNTTDNFSTGNLAANVNITTGKVDTPGIKRLASCSPIYTVHPITNVNIIGFKIPFWQEIITLVKQAAIVVPQVRTIGWDIAILEDKPIIIEGNPRWNKGAPQIPQDRGIKPLLSQYLKDV